MYLVLCDILLIDRCFPRPVMMVEDVLNAPKATPINVTASEDIYI